MLNCILCDYIRKFQKTEGTDFCNKYLCEYSNKILTEEDILELDEHPCYKI